MVECGCDGIVRSNAIPAFSRRKGALGISLAIRLCSYSAFVRRSRSSGFECGIGLENYNDIKPGDIIEAYQIEFVKQQLDS